MENLSLCRICLATNVRLCSVTKHLQDMYENITSMAFKREDRRPLVVCYICHARLQNCHRLRMSCLQSDRLLTEILNSGDVKPQGMLISNSLSIVRVLQLSTGGVTECHVKKEPPGMKCDGDLQQQLTEAIVVESQKGYGAHIDEKGLCTHIVDNDQGSQFKDPLEVTIKREADGVETDTPLWKKITESNSHLTSEPLSKCITFDELLTCTIASTSSQTNTHTDTKQIICNICNKIFLNDRLLKRHMHTHTDEKRFQCDICNKCFRVKQELTQHTYTHTGEKPFQCYMCEKTCRSKQHLKKHLKTHTGEKHFQCNICKKNFGRNFSLSRHMYTHTLEKPFRCDSCDKSFKSSQNLKQHMYTHTGEKLFRCEVCDKGFRSKQHVTRHMQMHSSNAFNFPPYR